MKPTPNGPPFAPVACAGLIPAALLVQLPSVALVLYVVSWLLYARAR